MKKLVLACTVLLIVAALTAPSARAECYKFASFCDGLQIDSGNWPNNGQWYHYDCSNNSTLSAAIRKSPRFTDNCSIAPGGARKGLLWSVAPNGPGDFYFVFDAPRDGTIDMHQGVYPGGTCWIDELEYVYQVGACHDLQGEQPQRSSIQ